MTAMPGMPGFGPWLYQATSVKFVGIPMFPSPFHESPTLCMLAFTPIDGMMSRAGWPGSAKEVPLPCGAVNVETDSSTNACAANPRVCRNSERPATSRPTPTDNRTAFFIYFPYPPPVSGKPGGMTTGGRGAPARTFTKQVVDTPPLLTDIVLRPVPA